MLTCKNCKLEKDTTDFYKNKKCCKSCIKEYNINYYKNNYLYFKEKRDIWNVENREYRNEYAKNEYHDNKEYYSNKSKEYRKENRDRLNQNKREWDKNRKIEEKRKYRNEYALKKKKEDPLYNIKCLMRSYVSSIFKNKGYKKSLKTVEILGCSFEEFKLHLESKFEYWMNWENRGLYNGELNHGWDIDHIIPLSSSKSEEEVIKLNHYTNLQPLCSHINRDIKKDKQIY